MKRKKKRHKKYSINSNHIMFFCFLHFLRKIFDISGIKRRELKEKSTET